MACGLSKSVNDLGVGPKRATPPKKNERDRQPNDTPVKMIKTTVGTGDNKTAKTFLRIWSWNIEALGGVGALSILALIGDKEAVDLFCLQEVRWEGTHDFIIKEGWRFISIGVKNSFAGLAFLIAPKIHIGVIGYLLLCDRVATLLLRTVSGPALFINFHAETEDKSVEVIKIIWKLVEGAYGYYPEAYPKYVIGDGNLRIHFRRPHEDPWLGPHIAGRGDDYLRRLEHTHNRDLAFEFCTPRNIRHMNSRFQHETQHKVTYREISTSLGTPKS